MTKIIPINRALPREIKPVKKTNRPEAGMPLTFIRFNWLSGCLRQFENLIRDQKNMQRGLSHIDPYSRYIGSDSYQRANQFEMDVLKAKEYKP